MAESKGAYQPWRHESFMADRKVRKMTPIALKTYMLLLHEAFVCETRPNLPDDESRLEEMALCTDREEWLSVKESVLAMFDKATVDGATVLTRKRLIEDWEKLREIREARSEAGKASAAKRKSTSVEHSLTNEHKKESKYVIKEREEKKEVENPSFDFEDGQGELMKIKKELQAVCAGFGVKTGGYQSTWEEINALAVAHSVGAVVRDFEEWMQEYQGDDFPQGAVSKYLHVAAARLGQDSGSGTAVLKDPAVVGLTRELTYLSDGAVNFGDKQRIRLAEVLKEFSAAEIILVFKTWLGDQDLSDPKNTSFLPGKFVQIADGLCYAAKKKAEASAKDAVARAAAVERIQAEAAKEREEAEKKKAQEESFDPLADIVGESI